MSKRRARKPGKKTPRTVVVVTYEWRTWSRDVFVFDSMAKAEAHVIQTTIDEHPIVRPAPSDLQSALDILTGDTGDSCDVDERKVR